MSATGSANEIVVGFNSTIQIGSRRWDLKRVVNLDIGSAIYSDSTPLGMVHHVGNSNNSFTVEVYISEPDIPTLVEYQDKTNGIPSSQTITLTMRSHAGQTGTISGSGFIYNVNVQDTDGENKVVAILTGKFTGTITTS